MKYMKAEPNSPASARRSRVAAAADEVDVGRAVDLAAAQEEGVDAPLRRAVEQLDVAVGERIVPLAAEDRHAQAAARAFARGTPRRGIGEAAPTAT